ncbi:MAG TPA: amidohydrolase family protein [Conexibacter sp.]|nr:amidohydrolase family protein [Conexibacter sp.]
MQRTDVHQHLLGEPLIAELARRRRPPALIRRRGGWTFRLAGEPDSVLARAAIDPQARQAALNRDGVDRALVALSTALGIETLPAEEAIPLIDAYQRSVDALPARFGAWGAVQLDEPDPHAVDVLIGRGAVGLSLPATALATPAGLERVGPLLERLEQHDAPLFVHPGPVAADARGAGEALPAWWPALTDYVAQMHAAWFAFLHVGRRAHPRLRVLFAMLAGGAPLQLERLAARGGPADAAVDPLIFYDTSSYGPRALRAAIAVVGAGQLVHGSDRPVVEPLVPSADTALGHGLLRVNPHRLLAGKRERAAA